MLIRNIEPDDNDNENEMTFTAIGAAPNRINAQKG